MTLSNSLGIVVLYFLLLSTGLLTWMIWLQMAEMKRSLSESLTTIVNEILTTRHRIDRVVDMVNAPLIREMRRHELGHEFDPSPSLSDVELSIPNPKKIIRKKRGGTQS